MYAILNTHGHDLAIPLDSPILAAVGQAILVERRGYSSTDPYVEQDKELDVSLIQDARLVRLDSDEAKVLTEQDVDKAKSERDAARLELAREKCYHKHLAAALSCGLTAEKWRAQVDAVKWGFDLEKLTPKAESAAD